MRALERRVCKDEQRIRVCAVLFTAEYFFPLIVACYTICASKKKNNNIVATRTLCFVQHRNQPAFDGVASSTLTVSA